MNLRLFAGTITLTLMNIGCGHDSAAVVRTDAGTNVVIDGGNSNDASAMVLLGGMIVATSNILAQIRDLSCTVPPGDAGVSPLTDLDGGTCVYPIPPQQPNSTAPIDQIIVVWVTDSSQSYLFGESSTSACPSGDGWYLSSDNSIVLCPQSCSRVVGNSGGLIQVYATCRYPTCGLC